jgi:hypothetical protein
MMRPSPDDALSETARLAYHFHWPLDTILDLEHADRRRFLAEADALAGHPPAGRAQPVDHPMADPRTGA